MALLAPALPEPSLRILTYHRVNDDHPGDRLSVRTRAFAAQMELLVASGRPVLPLAEAAVRLRGRGEPLPPGALCLTFDDGYHDNLEHAAPVLDRHRLPAAIFVVTLRMGAEAAIDRYAGCCERDRALSWDEARELECRGHSVGGHGRTHRELAPLDPASLRGEVFGCRADLVRELGAPPRLFCYPRGSDSEEVRRVVAEAGFEAAVTVYPGGNGATAEPLRLRRTEVSGYDEPSDFRLKIAGAFDAWHRFRQRLRARGA